MESNSMNRIPATGLKSVEIDELKTNKIKFGRLSEIHTVMLEA